MTIELGIKNKQEIKVDITNPQTNTMIISTSKIQSLSIMESQKVKLDIIHEEYVPQNALLSPFGDTLVSSSGDNLIY